MAENSLSTPTTGTTQNLEALSNNFITKFFFERFSISFLFALQVSQRFGKLRFLLLKKAISLSVKVKCLPHEIQIKFLKFYHFCPPAKIKVDISWTFWLGGQHFKNQKSRIIGTF